MKIHTPLSQSVQLLLKLGSGVLQMVEMVEVQVETEEVDPEGAVQRTLHQILHLKKNLTN